MIRDGDWELLAWNPVSGVSTWRYFNGERWIYRTDTPVTSLLNETAEQRNTVSSGWSGDYHSVARIPLTYLTDGVLNEAMQEGDEDYFTRWLNDADNSAFRTKEGRI